MFRKKRYLLAPSYTDLTTFWDEVPTIPTTANTNIINKSLSQYYLDNYNFTNVK